VDRRLLIFMEHSLEHQHWPTATLYVVATPIGNLADLTERARYLLQHCDAIAAEDTRHTSILLKALGLSKPLLACHEHNEQEAAVKVRERLQLQQRVAYVSDAGTPGVSDPGARLVQAVREAGFGVMPVPGVSAVTAALSVSGLVSDGFYFAGFLPNKAQARRDSLRALSELTVALVFYEAPHRLLESVAAMHEVFGAVRDIIIARELTKRFEQIQRCPLSQALSWLQAEPAHGKGEFVLIVEGKNKDEPGPDGADAVLKPLLATLPTKQAVALAREITGLSRNVLYDRALKLKAGH
jgi:16S rRNA (cytidine1402-2'-O)-methyltransferase